MWWSFVQPYVPVWVSCIFIVFTHLHQISKLPKSIILKTDKVHWLQEHNFSIIGFLFTTGTFLYSPAKWAFRWSISWENNSEHSTFWILLIHKDCLRAKYWGSFGTITLHDFHEVGFRWLDWDHISVYSKLISCFIEDRNTGHTKHLFLCCVVFSKSLCANMKILSKEWWLFTSASNQVTNHRKLLSATMREWNNAIKWTLNFVIQRKITDASKRRPYRTTAIALIFLKFIRWIIDDHPTRSCPRKNYV